MNSRIEETLEAVSAAVLVVVALFLIVGCGTAHAATGGETRAKAKVSAKDVASTYMSAGMSIPGLIGGMQTRVNSGKLPIYIGGDLEVLFPLIFDGVTIMPTFSAALHIPTKIILTPTIGIALGPSFVIGGDRSTVGFVTMIKPGLLIQVDKNLQVDVQLRVGAGTNIFFVFLPQAGVRFAL